VQFASYSYMLFLALAVIVYFGLPGTRSRTAWLLASSYFFYYTLSTGWTLVLLGVTVVGYVCGRLLDRTETPHASGSDTRSRLVLWSGIVLVVGTLAVFKYADFAIELLNGVLGTFGSPASTPALALALPVGISFWTFQTIAYLVDIARGSLSAEKNFVRYAVFIAFFPHVAAGPIARGAQLLPQLSAARHRFTFEAMRSGLLLMLWGFIKKTLVADPMGVFVGKVFADPRSPEYAGLVLLAAAVGFSIQIYCDFSGYTDIARGAARLFGLELLPNFRRPYASRSVKEFWRRWHMSLMSWLKDYIYIPLGGSRVSRSRRYVNVLAVFAISGLWHGAGLTFIVWGLLNGLYQVLGEITAPVRERLWAMTRLSPDGRLRQALQIAVTFVLITIGWVFFRAGSLSDALYIITHMLEPVLTPLTNLTGTDVGLTGPVAALTAAAAVAVLGIDYLSARIDLPAFVYRQPVAIRWAIYQLAILAVAVCGQYGPTLKSADFVYFKF